MTCPWLSKNKKPLPYPLLGVHTSILGASSGFGPHPALEFGPGGVNKIRQPFFVWAQMGPDVEPILDHFGGWYVSTYPIKRDQTWSNWYMWKQHDPIWSSLDLGASHDVKEAVCSSAGVLRPKLVGPTKIVGFDKNKLSNPKNKPSYWRTNLKHLGPSP